MRGAFSRSQRGDFFQRVLICAFVALWMTRTSGTASPSLPSGWKMRGDADVQAAEDARDLGDDAGAVLDGEAQVVFGDDLVDRLAGAVEAVRHEAVIAARRLQARRRLRRGRR